MVSSLVVMSKSDIRRPTLRSLSAPPPVADDGSLRHERSQCRAIDKGDLAQIQHQSLAPIVKQVADTGSNGVRCVAGELAL